MFTSSLCTLPILYRHKKVRRLLHEMDTALCAAAFQDVHACTSLC
jgi:hypothetical protein